MPSIAEEIEDFRRRDPEGSPEPEPQSPELTVAEVARAEAQGKESKSTDEEQADALAWFLSDTDETPLEHTFEINVGGPDHKVWVPWTVKPVDMDRLRKIRRQSQPKGRRGVANAQEFDEVAANVAIVVEGTLKPDLRSAARELGIVDPGMAVRTRFAHKPGLLSQISTEIMNISGYDDEDVREVDAALG